MQAQWDHAVSLAKVGDALARQGQDDAALAEYAASLAILEPLAADDRANQPGLQRDVFKNHEAIGVIRLDQGELDAAQRSFEAALAVALPLAAADPANGLLQRELSVLRNRLGDVLEARGQLRRGARRIPRGFGGPPDACSDRSDQCAGAARPVAEPRAGGRACCAGRRACRMRWWSSKPRSPSPQQLAAAEPANREWQRELAIAQRNVARVLDAQGRSDAALEAYQAALAIAEQLATAEPSDVATQRDLLRRYSDLGSLQERAGRRAEAQQSYCQAKAVVAGACRPSARAATSGATAASGSSNGCRRRRTGLRPAELPMAFKSERANVGRDMLDRSGSVAS